jgi:hypothetical protein
MIALTILASAVEHGAAPPELLRPFHDEGSLNRGDARWAELLTRIRGLLPASRPDGGSPA